MLETQEKNLRINKSKSTIQLKITIYIWNESLIICSENIKFTEMERLDLMYCFCGADVYSALPTNTKVQYGNSVSVRLYPGISSEQLLTKTKRGVSISGFYWINSFEHSSHSHK